MEQITIESFLKNKESIVLEEDKNETWRERINEPCIKGLNILRDYDARMCNVIYHVESDISKLSKNLSKDINPLFDAIANQIKQIDDVVIRKVLFNTPVTLYRIYNFMNLYVKHCSILENKHRLDVAKTILMLFPCNLKGEYKTVTEKKPENIEIDGINIREQFETNNFKIPREMIIPLSAYLFDVVYDHSLKKEFYTEQEEDIICYLAHVFLGQIAYPKSIINPYVLKLEEILMIIFKDWKVTDDIDICWYHSNIIKKYNQRMAKETVKIYTKNKEQKRICNQYEQISMFYK